MVRDELSALLTFWKAICYSGMAHSNKAACGTNEELSQGWNKYAHVEEPSPPPPPLTFQQFTDRGRLNILNSRSFGRIKVDSFWWSESVEFS